MASKSTLYGVAAMLVVGLIVSSSVAYYYYNQYQGEVSSSQRYQLELQAALTRANLMSTSLNSSLSDYKTTLSLLTDAVANLNTSTPSYINASVELGPLWQSYTNLAALSGSASVSYSIGMEVDYGNGTKLWYNGTSIEPGWNGYVATLVVLSGAVQATWYPQYQEHFVTGIGGVSSNSSNSWFVWQYQGSQWVAAPTGADGIQVYNGTLLAWTLCGYDVDFNPTCKP